MKNADIIEAYLVKKNYEYKRTNDQFMLKRSPISGEEKRNHFYVAEDTGLRKDHKQGTGGNRMEFLDMHGDMYDLSALLSEDTSS